MVDHLLFRFNLPLRAREVGTAGPSSFMEPESTFFPPAGAGAKYRSFFSNGDLSPPLTVVLPRAKSLLLSSSARFVPFLESSTEFFPGKTLRTSLPLEVPRDKRQTLKGKVA